MTPERPERRLAAILAADMVGYSRLMETDEAGTFARQKARRQELIDPKITESRGRIVKTTGDGLLVEFTSVVDATECAVAIQRAMLECEAAVPEEQRIRYRIGINLGDIIIDGDDILGDGVNVAARLEGLAEPGGICIPRKVFHEVRNKLDVGYEYIGEQKVKNIETAVPVYRVRLDPKAAGKIIGEKLPNRPRWRPIAAAAAVVAVIAAVWWQPWAQRVEPASLERMAFPLPEKPSIAVLPFVNLSGDPGQEYLADGFTEDIITALSSVPDLFVIARNSTFTYKGKAVKVQQVAEEMGVRYVLEGSVQRSGKRIRVTAQLVDALLGHHLWSERHDREMKELFALQDEVALDISRALEVELTLGEGRSAWSRGTDNLEAWAQVARAREAYLLFTKENNSTARRLLQDAVELDPHYAIAWDLLAWTHIMDARFSWSTSPADSFQTAHKLADKSLTLNGERASPYSLLAFLALIGRRFDEAIAHHEQAVVLEPNDESVKVSFASTLIYAGRPHEGIGLLEQAMRISPYYPGYYLLSLGRAYRLAGRDEEAIKALESAKERMPGNWLTLTELVTAYSEAGRHPDAEAEVVNILTIKADATVQGLAALLLYQDPNERIRILNALRMAGLPE